jgi:hypothetical protein
MSQISGHNDAEVGATKLLEPISNPSTVGAAAGVIMASIGCYFWNSRIFAAAAIWVFVILSVIGFFVGNLTALADYDTRVVMSDFKAQPIGYWELWLPIGFTNLIVGALAYFLRTLSWRYKNRIGRTRR